MLGGEDIRNVPWEGGAMDEIDAFVSEELYVHSKVSIICTLLLSRLTIRSFSLQTTRSSFAVPLT